MILTLEQAKKMMERNGGSLYLRDTQITDIMKAQRTVRKLQDGDYEKGRYLYADGILRHVKKRKICGTYTLYIGKIPGQNVVSDGAYYAHCGKLRDGISDLMFKAAKDRGAEQYKGLDLDAQRTVEELKTMYRVITGACRQGTESFVNGLGALKERYSIREVIELTHGQYGAGVFAQFFVMEGAE